MLKHWALIGLLSLTSACAPGQWRSSKLLKFVRNSAQQAENSDNKSTASNKQISSSGQQGSDFQLKSEALKFYLPPEYHSLQAMIVGERVSEDENGYRFLNLLLREGLDIWLLSRSQTHFNQILEHLVLNYGLSKEQLQKIHFLKVATESAWARDWVPLLSVPRTTQNSAQGSEIRMLDMMYYYLFDRPEDERAGDELHSRLQEQVSEFVSTKVTQLKLPLFGEGGNIMCSQHNCVISEGILLINQDKAYTPYNAPEARDLEGIRQLFHQQLDQEFLFVHRLPYETTGHIDMWAKLLNEDTLLIAELSDESIASAPPKLQPRYRRIQEFLKIQATGYATDGRHVGDAISLIFKHFNPNLKVLRVPMPIPVSYRDKFDEKKEIFRSYTNSVLVNKKAIVPRYRQMQDSAMAYPDHQLLARYEKQVESAYAQAGYEVIWLDGDYLIQDGGAWHCATMQVPRT